MTVAPTPQLRRAGLVISVASLAAIAFATLLPERPVAGVSHFCLVCGSFGGVNAVLNVFLFVPLGVGLALAGVPAKRAVLAAFAMSALVETAQLLVIPGRYATIGDVITNTIGGALGVAIGQTARIWIRPSPHVARNLVLAWAAISLGIQVVSNFGFSTSLPASQYHGQIARAIGSFAVFPGVVQNATVGDIQIPNMALADSRRVRQGLLAGGDVVATVVPGGSTAGIAPIVRLADEKNNEVALLAQYHDQLVFNVRTGAAELRLRPPRFALPGAFANGASTASGDENLRLSGRYLPRRVRLDAKGRSASDSSLVQLSASMGWTFWLPFQWFVEGTTAERVVGAIWMACLAIPLGYWGLGIVDSSPSRGILVRWAPTLIASVVFFCVAFILIPRAFGLAPAPAHDWLATLAGIAIGCGLNATVQAHR
jgi:hypothetical protein